MTPAFLPPIVASAMERAQQHAFGLSCEPAVGRLLVVLAAGVPTGGRILELGTGLGAGLAWLVHGLGARADVAVTSVEQNRETAAVAQTATWPDYVEFLVDDAVRLLPSLGRFDLIFADAAGGKWSGLDLTIAALRPRGVLIVDDMDLRRYDDPAHQATISLVRERLLNDPRLVAAELPMSTGIMLATRRSN